MRYLIIASIVAGLVAGSAGLAQNLPGMLSADARTVAQDNNVFALDLYSQLREKDGNLFISPYSISSALSMTYAGAKGKTAEEMATTLHLSLPPDKLHAAAGNLTKHFNNKKPGFGPRPYELSVANALWGQKGMNFLPAFLQVTEANYGAKMAELNFVTDPEPSRQTINKWVEKQTNDKIKDLIPPKAIKPATRLVLTNAIYFKSPWQNKFLTKNTKQEDFTLASGAKVKTAMMAQTEEMPYVDGGTFHAVSIPYQAHALSMIVLLPKEAAGLTKLEKGLTSAELEKLLKKMKRHEVNLKMPKFKVTSQFELSDVLTKMGMPTAFISGADFSGMTTQEKLFISAVIHKAFVDVNEAGTEAAAATAVIMLGDSKPQPAPKATFHADHPFVFLIRENMTGSILFMGRVVDPKS
jgi:serpin B